MNDSVRVTLGRVNTGMRDLLDRAQASLLGAGEFGPGEVRALRQLLAQVAPIVERSAELRRNQPETANLLDSYKSLLVELQQTVERLRVGLLVQRAGLEAKREHVNAAKHWCGAYHQTQ
jgi:hypothetical protein